MPVRPKTSPSSRHVPDSERRRAQVSCDRCKTRRVRCVRVSDDRRCKGCEDAGAVCESTIPRKLTRVHIQQARYEALEAIVKSLFPTEDCDDPAVLLRLASERNIDITPTSRNEAGLQEAEEPSPPLSIDASRTLARDPGIAQHRDVSSMRQTPAASAQAPQSSTRTSVPWPYNIDATIQGAVTSLPEETCIPAPHGVAHYVGPASSFEFANAIRRLVSLRSKSLDSFRNRQDLRSKLRIDFASLKTSIALEPRIETHPASTVRQEVAEGSLMDSASTPTIHGPHVGANNHRPTWQPDNPPSNSLQVLIPRRDVADQLIKAFFDRLHPNYVLFHRGTFHSRYDTIWQRAPTYRNEREPGWLCSLFMVFVFGAQLLEQEGLEDAAELQRTYLALVRERFHNLTLTANLSNVQALLLLQLYQHNAGERNTSWILLGQAARMAVALGMHREGTSHNFDSIERNTRRMVWFTLYSFEQYVSLSLGRPSAIKALEVNVRLPDEAILDGGDYPPGYLLHASTLLDLASKVRHFATAASPNYSDEKVLISMFDSMTIISKELREWDERLPRYLRTDWQFISPRHIRAVILLHMNYHHISSVLTRPYLLCKVEQEIKNQATAETSGTYSQESIIRTYAEECISSSMAVADMLHRLSTESLLEGVGWTDFFYLYHAMLVLCLDFLSHRQVSLIAWTPREREISASVSFLIEMCQTNKLGPTYQILSQVAIQLAHIVHLAGDDGLSRDDSEHVRAEPTMDNSSESFRAKETSNPTVPEVPTSQYDVFMPYPEPIFGLNYFNNNDVHLDFFDTSGLGSMDSSVDPFNQYMSNSIQDPFEYSYPATFGRFN